MLIKKQKRLDAQGKGEILPTIAAMPELPEHLRDFWQGFQDCIKTSSGEPITHSELQSWFDNNGIALDERREFSTVIQSLDSVWREHVSRRRSEKTEAT